MQDALFVLSKLLWLVLRPGSLAVLAILVGVLALARGRRWGRWPAGLGLGLLLALLVLPVQVLLEAPLENRFPRPTPVPETVTGIVILGGAVETKLTEARGIPALNGAAERMTEAVALARRFPAARIVFTGGTASLLPGAVSEAEVARRLWTALGLDPARVTYESASRNTHENAVNTLALVKPAPGETWLLVTSASHMPRAMGVFRKAGWHVTAWPVNYRTGPGVTEWLDPSLGARLQGLEWNLREWVGLLAYRLLGRTDAVFPAP